MTFRMKVLGFLAVLGSALAPVSARAGFVLRVSSSAGPSTTVTDNGVGDLSPTVGVIIFSGTVGGFLINVDTGISKPILGSAASPHMDLSYGTTKLGLVGGAAAETLTIELTDTGFSTTPKFLIGNIGGTNTNTSTSFQWFFDNGNVEFGTAGGSSSLLFFPGTPFSGSNTNTVTGATPYSLTERVTIAAGAGDANASGNAELLSAVPAPPTALLALLALPMLGVWAVARRRRTVLA